MEHSTQFSYVDLVALALILLGIVRGFVKGLSGELAGLISAAVAAIAGFKFYRPLGEYFLRSTHLSEAAAYSAAFATVTLGSYALMRILRFLLRHMMEFSFKGRLERLGGALVGGLSVAVTVIVFVFIMGILPSSTLHSLFAQDSFLGRTVCSKLGPVYERLSEKYPALQIPANGEEPVAGEGRSEERGAEPME